MVFAAVVGDTLLRLLSVPAKVVVLLAMPADSPARLRRRGHVLTAVEYCGALYRLLPPAPLWYHFFCVAAPGSMLQTGLSGAYLLVKAQHVFERAALAALAVRQVAARSFGSRPTPEEVQEAGGACPICQARAHLTPRLPSMLLLVQLSRCGGANPAGLQHMPSGMQAGRRAILVRLVGAINCFPLCWPSSPPLLPLRAGRLPRPRQAVLRPHFLQRLLRGVVRARAHLPHVSSRRWARLKKVQEHGRRAHAVAAHRLLSTKGHWLPGLAGMKYNCKQALITLALPLWPHGFSA